MSDQSVIRVETSPGAKRIAEIDPDELAVRLLEIGTDLKRPAGVPARDILARRREVSARDGEAAEVMADFERMAEAAILYFGECIAKMRTVQ
jgi:hypothetical protein